MRIAVEVDGAEISILAKEAVAKATPGEMLAAIVSGEALDAGAAAAPGETVGAETAAGQEVVAPAAAAGGLDAGPAPGAGSGEVSGQVEPVAPGAGGGEAIDAGTAKFTPPGEAAEGEA